MYFFITVETPFLYDSPSEQSQKAEYKARPYNCIPTFGAVVSSERSCDKILAIVKTIPRQTTPNIAPSALQSAKGFREILRDILYYVWPPFTKFHRATGNCPSKPL